MTAPLEFKKPLLAACNNRQKLAKKNHRAGAPEDWLNSRLLEEKRLHLLSFDFFVDWSQHPPPVERRIWIKRLVKDKSTPWPITNRASIQSSLQDIDGNRYLKALGAFGKKYDFLVQYMLFKDSEDWTDDHAPLVVANLGLTGQITNVQKTTLLEVKHVIQTCSGGPVSIGRKGLYYGTSRLECILSHTASLWPGDVDGILLDKNDIPTAILEYKKHTKSGKIANQKLSNYYPKPDKRKYERLVSLRNYLDPDLPIVVIYYPTKEYRNKIRIEIIDGSHGHLTPMRSGIYPLPSKKDTASHKIFLQQLLNEINIYTNTN